MSGPIIWTWDGESMWPLRHFVARCNRELVVGEQYRTTVVEERSVEAHSHYFARLHELWLSLPDALATEFPTETALRKRALIMTGYRREKRWIAADKEEARKLAAWLRPGVDEDDEYALVSINEKVVIRWTALSQSKTAMPAKGQFYESKQKVLDWIEDLIGVKDSGEARGSEGHVPEDAAVPVTQPPGTIINASSNEEEKINMAPQAPLGARLRALAESLRRDTPEAFEAAWAVAKVAAEPLALYRAAPKQVEAIKKLSAQTAGGNFNDVEYEEVLVKIIAAADG